MKYKRSFFYFKFYYRLYSVGLGNGEDFPETELGVFRDDFYLLC